MLKLSFEQIEILLCWSIAAGGLGMLLKATTWRGKLTAHAAVVVSLVSLSAIALDRPQWPPPYSALIGRIGDAEYHAAGCVDLPLEEADVRFRSHDEAQWAGKKPHACLLDQSPEEVAQHHEQHGGTDAGEEINGFVARFHPPVDRP